MLIKNMKTKQTCGPTGAPCIKWICPSQNTALGRKEHEGWNACGASSLKEASHELSIVMTRGRESERLGTRLGQNDFFLLFVVMNVYGML